MTSSVKNVDRTQTYGVFVAMRNSMWAYEKNSQTELWQDKTQFYKTKKKKKLACKRFNSRLGTFRYVRRKTCF